MERTEVLRQKAAEVEAWAKDLLQPGESVKVEIIISGQPPIELAKPTPEEWDLILSSFQGKEAELAFVQTLKESGNAPTRIKAGILPGSNINARLKRNGLPFRLQTPSGKRFWSEPIRLYRINNLR